MFSSAYRVLTDKITILTLSYFETLDCDSVSAPKTAQLSNYRVGGEI